MIRRLLFIPSHGRSLSFRLVNHRSYHAGRVGPVAPQKPPNDHWRDPLPTHLPLLHLKGRSYSADARRSNKKRHSSPSFSKAKEINTKIMSLGKQRRIDDLFELFKQKRQSFSHVNFATMMIQIQRMGRQGVSRNDPRLKALLIEIGKQFQNPATAGNWTPRHLANVVYAMSKISSFQDTEARNILDYVENDTVLSGIMQSGAPQTVANILWAYAKRGYESPVVFGAAERHIDRVLEGGNSQEFANMLWAYAKQGYRSPIVFEAAEQHIHRVFKHGNSQDVANTLWAYATQGYESPVVFGAAQKHIHRVLDHGTTQNMANILWAYATQGYESPIVFGAVEQRIHRVFEGGTPQNIANTLWAYAKQGYESPVVFEAAERHINRVLEEGNPQAINNTLWAYATQGYESPVVFGAVEQHIHRVFEHGNSQVIANILWAYATQGYDSPVVFGAAERHINRVLEDGNPQAITNTLWAYATQGYESPVVFGAVEQHIHRVFEHGNSQVIANILWAYATQGYDSPVVFGAAERHINRVFEDGNPQDFANTLWAYAIQGFGNEGHDVDTFLSLWSKAVTIPWAKFRDEGKLQLLGSWVMASSEFSMHVPKEWLKNAKMLGQENSDSKLQTEISASFNKIGFEHQLEVDPVTKLIPGYLAIDIACRKAKIAIEVDGPWHYLRKLRPDNGAVPKENGPTKAKRRLLTRLGWTVINIPYFSLGTSSSPNELRKNTFVRCSPGLATGSGDCECLPWYSNLLPALDGAGHEIDPVDK